MKSYRKELWLHLPSRRGFVNITSQVEEAVHESGIKECMVLVNAMLLASLFYDLSSHSGMRFGKF
jgi:thiamine phosphate synthase YjbQ (UPF0047 family)